MVLGSMTENEFPEVVLATGMIDVPPQNKAVISSFAEGYIKKTYLLVGNKVKKGQMLVSIEDPQFVQMQQDYLETLEQLTYLKSEYERQKTLYNENISSQKKYLKAESDYKMALARFNGLKKKLKLLNINPENAEQGNISSVISLYAPISGYITKINISIGEHVSPSDEIMQIVNSDHFHIELNVFEKDAMKIKKGQKIEFRIPESSSETFKAEVYLVGSSISSENRTVTVHGHLADDIREKLSTGMFVEARIFTEEQKFIALPEDAIINVENRDLVLKLKEKNKNEYIFEEKIVETGETINGFTRIKNHSDFKASDQFIIKGGFSLIGE
jgi:cobalt-zinc-cadmium efflux system membrane fusion protein